VTGEGAGRAEETAVDTSAADGAVAAAEVVALAPAAGLAPADADTAHLPGLSRAGARGR